MARRITLLLTLFLFLTISSFSQKLPIKFGKIDEADLKMKKYPGDPDAEALVLGEFGESRFKYHEDKGFQLIFDYHVQIKILTKEGYDYADVKIPLYEGSQGLENLSRVRGYTYNLEDGKLEKTKLKADAKFEEKYNDYWSLYSITMPQVSEGSIIEYKYTIISDYYSNLREWKFQKEIPVRWSEYRAVIPEYFNYQQISQGYLPLDIVESDLINETYKIKYTTDPMSGGRVERRSYDLPSQSKKYRWVSKDVPALRDVDFIPSINDYQSKIEFGLMSVKFPSQPIKMYLGTYETMTKTYLDHSDFGQQLEKRNFLSDVIPNVISEKTTEVAKLNAIYEHIKNRMTWNGNYGVLVKQNLKKIYAEQKGSAPEINLLLTAALREAGIDAVPILSSTRKNGRPHPIYPLFSKFNYVLVGAEIEGKQILLDATHKSMPMNVLPKQCLNGKGRWMSMEDPKWVDLTGSGVSKQSIKAKLDLTHPEQSHEVEISSDGYVGLETRQKFFKVGEEEFVNERTSDFSQFAITETDIDNQKQQYEPFVEKYNFAFSDPGRFEAPIIYMDPFIAGKISENPFKAERRDVPIDLEAPIEELYMIEMTIPDGYKVEEAPAPVAIALPNNGGKFMFSITNYGNKINLVSQFKIDKTYFLPQEYGNLRQFYTLVVAKHAEQIVLKKINN